MSETIKLNEGIEGAEVRDAAKWLKPILGDHLNKMKIGRKGVLFSFIDASHVIAGKVFIPSTGELWKSEKEVGFNCDRLYNAFSIFKKRDKTELYIKDTRIFLKNGGLKWRYDMEDVEQAQKIDFSKIPTPAIRININDLIPLKSINKGKRGGEKSSQICFRYGNGKATLFVFDRYGKNRIDLGEVEAEGEGVGVAHYNLILLEKLIKNAKSGYLRIEENKPAQLKILTGKKTKAILYLARMFDSDLIEEIRGKGAPSSPAVTTEESEEVKELKDDIKTDEETLENVEKEEENREPEAGEKEIFNADAPKLEEDIKQAKAELDKIQEQEKSEHDKYLARIDKAATDTAEEVEREKTEEAFKETEKAVKEWEDTYKETTHKEIREEVVKEGVSFLTVREANGAAFHNSKEVYEDMKAEAQIDRECMWVLHLVGGKVLKKELVAMGKGNAAYTTPREVYRRAIIEGTTKIIMVHNHPSGDPEPSDADISTCEGYIKAGELLGIGLLDFLVIGTQGYTSFADKGIGGF